MMCVLLKCDQLCRMDARTGLHAEDSRQRAFSTISLCILLIEPHEMTVRIID